MTALVDHEETFRLYDELRRRGYTVTYNQMILTDHWTDELSVWLPDGQIKRFRDKESVGAFLEADKRARRKADCERAGRHHWWHIFDGDQRVCHG